MLPHVTVVVNIGQLQFSIPTDMSGRISTHDTIHQTQILVVLIHYMETEAIYVVKCVMMVMIQKEEEPTDLQQQQGEVVL